MSRWIVLGFALLLAAWWRRPRYLEARPEWWAEPWGEL